MIPIEELWVPFPERRAVLDKEIKDTLAIGLYKDLVYVVVDRKESRYVCHTITNYMESLLHSGCFLPWEGPIVVEGVVVSMDNFSRELSNAVGNEIRGLMDATLCYYVCGICQNSGHATTHQFISQQFGKNRQAYRYPPLSTPDMRALGLTLSVNSIVGVDFPCQSRCCQACGRGLSPKRAQVRRWLAFRDGDLCERCIAPSLQDVSPPTPSHAQLRHLSKWSRKVT